VTSPSRILYALAGSPPQEGVETTGNCRVCALPLEGKGQPFHQWAGSSFTDQNKVKHAGGTHVCAPCIWCHAWTPPPGSPAREGKGHNLRMYSHLWHNGEYRYLNKADKPAILAFLRSPKTGPWFAAISDTGQKHLLPYTPLNPAGCRNPAVRFEEQTVMVGSWMLVTDMTALLTAGVTKAEIAEANYTPRSWMAHEKALRDFEEGWPHVRGSGWFALCLWLAQRDEVEYQRRMDEQRTSRNATKRDGKPTAGGAKRAPAKRGKPDEALGPVADANAQRGTDQRQCAGVGDSPRAGVGAAGPVQGSLFGD